MRDYRTTAGQRWDDLTQFKYGYRIMQLNQIIVVRNLLFRTWFCKTYDCVINLNIMRLTYWLCE